VDAYYGRVDKNRRFIDRYTCTMTMSKVLGKGLYEYQCDVLFAEAGHFGLNIRITPNHPTPESRHAMGLVAWGSA
nr:hypothetical protein [Deltaproteobacteria bacterium]